MECFDVGKKNQYFLFVARKGRMQSALEWNEKIFF